MGLRFRIASAATVCLASASLSACSSNDYEAPACRPRGGGANVSALPSICPKIADYSVSPTEIEGNAPVALTASADATDAGVLTFAWTATAGQIANASSANTTFQCASAGPVTLTLTISNGVCGDSVTVALICL